MTTAYIINRECVVNPPTPTGKAGTPITLTNSLSTTPAIPFQSASGGSVILKANSNITNLAFYGGKFATTGGTFLPCNDVQCSGGTWTVTPASYAVSPGSTGLEVPIPGCCYGCPALAIVATFSSGTSEAVDIVTKS